MQEEQQYSYFLYILFFQFASINDQPYIYFFQVLALILLGDFQTQVLIKSNLIFAYSGDRKGVSLSILYAVPLITEHLCPKKEL